MGGEEGASEGGPQIHIPGYATVPYGVIINNNNNNIK